MAINIYNNIKRFKINLHKLNMLSKLQVQLTGDIVRQPEEEGVTDEFGKEETE